MTHLNRALLFGIDEGQILASQRHFADIMLRLRHFGVHMLINFQNISTAPVELLGNCDALICFQSVDKRDRDTFANAATLTRDQAERLAILEQGECVCFLPRSCCKHPILGTTLRLIFGEPHGTVEERSAEFAKEFNWVPLQESAEHAAVEVERVDSATRQFINDCLMEQHRFSRLTRRFERAGVRSAEKQQRILRALQDSGFIKTWDLAINVRGRPITLVEPLIKLFETLNTNKWTKGNSTYAAQAGIAFLYNRLVEIDGAYVKKEGVLNGKAVDLLLRHNETVVTFEVAYQGAHEIHNCTHCLRCSEVTNHIVVALSKKVEQEVKKHFAGVDEIKDDSRVEIMMLSKALNRDWMEWLEN